MEPETATVREREARPPVGVFSPGAALDRYVILERIGEGGMGTVYAAYDHALDRKIAIKLVRSASGPEGAEILLAEAKAMAKLGHPAVVAVHDVGEYRGQVFIAMEYVEGQNLREYLADHALDQHAKLLLLRRVGEGLAAAHRGEIVHRDFKPDNVLITRDGRPKVADFGLAKGVGAVQIASPIGDSGGAGTPGYMSPEQRAGELTDARTDQYAFCVSMIEAFTGNREVPTYAALSKVMPKRVARAVLRGVADTPMARWPTMDALLEAIAPRTRRWAVAGLAVILAGAVITTLVITRTRAREAGLDCEAVASRADRLWNPERTAQLARKLAAGSADATLATAVERGFTSWIVAWRRTARASCARTRDGTQAPALHDMRMACLELSRARAQDLVTDITGADAERFGLAVPQAANSMPDQSTCTRDDELLGWSASFPPGEKRADLEAAQREVFDAAALADVGRYDDARPKFLAAIKRTRALGFTPLIAEAALLFGQSEAFAGRGDAAAAALFESIALAEVAGAGRIATDAWIRLVYVQGYLRGHASDAIAFAEIARARIRRNPSSLADAEVVLDGAVGSLLADHGHAAEALPILERHVAHFEANPDPVNLISALQGLAGAHMVLGNFDLARDLCARAITIAREQLPLAHPALPASLALLVQIHVLARRGPELLAAATQALELQGAAAQDDPVSAAHLRDRGYAYFLLGKPSEARADLERALTLLEKLADPDDPELQRARYDLGLLELDAQRTPRARTLLEQAIAGTRAAPAERRLEPSYVPLVELERVLALTR